LQRGDPSVSINSVCEEIKERKDRKRIERSPSNKVKTDATSKKYSSEVARRRGVLVMKAREKVPPVLAGQVDQAFSLFEEIIGKCPQEERDNICNWMSKWASHQKAVPVQREK
jgi:hypothetical protein